MIKRKLLPFFSVLTGLVLVFVLLFIFNKFENFIRIGRFGEIYNPDDIYWVIARNLFTLGSIVSGGFISGKIYKKTISLYHEFVE